MGTIAVIDYGMGNLRSVEKALEEAGGRTLVTSKPADLKRCSKIVFPGVGAFGDAMKELRRLGLADPIRESIAAGKPFLGLCLGLQLLFEKSEEAPGVKGLGILKGEVKKFRFTNEQRRTTNDALKVPHMGWNSIEKAADSPLLKDTPDKAYVYFVHSYYVKPDEKKAVLTMTDYGITFASGVRKDNIYGLQFHPEKSQALGLKMLKNFVKLK